MKYYIVKKRLKVAVRCWCAPETVPEMGDGSFSKREGEEIFIDQESSWRVCLPVSMLGTRNPFIICSKAVSGRWRLWTSVTYCVPGSRDICAENEGMVIMSFLSC